MSATANPKQRLQELQQLAQECNRQLVADFPAVDFGQGGNLFLGKYYGLANRLFLSLNPGGDYWEPFKTDSLDFNFWDRPNDGERNWKNCNYFVNGAGGLHEWISQATVAFCVPWRTRNGNGLNKLNSQTGGKLFEFAGNLVRKLLEDHQQAFTESKESNLTIIAAGRASLHLLASAPFLHFDWRAHQKCHNGAKGTYQWAKVEYRNIVLYQVPHFSRANSCQRLKECAEWLARDLRL